MISDKPQDQFAELYKKHFGRELSREEAVEQGTKLLRLMELIYRPMTEAEFRAFNKAKEEK
jgi:hypothetical protein